MTVMRSAFRSVYRRLFRTLLVSVVLALCVAVLISTIAGVKASEDSTQQMVDRTKAQTAEMVSSVETATEEIVASVEGSAEETAGLAEKMSLMIVVMGGFAGMSEGAVSDIYSINGVAAVVPIVTQRVGGSDEKRVKDYDYAVKGVPLEPSLIEEYPVLPLYIVDGRTLAEEDGAAVLLNVDLAGYFEAEVGDTIALEESDFEVVGTYFTVSFTDQKTVYMSLDNAQNLFNLGDGLSELQVFAETQSDVDNVAGEIEALNNGWKVLTMEDRSTGKFAESIAFTQEEQVAKIQEQASQQISTIQQGAELQIASLEADLSSMKSLGVQISLVAGIAGVLMIFGIMFYTVRERTREIGILKAVGFSNRYVMKRFMLEGLYVGLLGGLIGLGLGAATCSLFGPWLLDMSEGTSVVLEPYQLLIGFGAAVLFGSLGSLYPAWRASRVSPMEALRHG